MENDFASGIANASAGIVEAAGGPFGLISWVVSAAWSLFWGVFSLGVLIAFAVIAWKLFKALGAGSELAKAIESAKDLIHGDDPTDAKPAEPESVKQNIDPVEYKNQLLDSVAGMSDPKDPAIIALRKITSPDQGKDATIEYLINKTREGRPVSDESQTPSGA